MKWIAFLGLAFLSVSIFLILRQHRLILGGLYLDGEVTEQVRVYDSDGDTFKIKVRYIRPNGEPSEFVTSTASRPPTHEVGEAVKVLYYPETQRASILSFGYCFGFAWGLACVGLFLFLLGGGFIVGRANLDKFYRVTEKSANVYSP
jgi:hypothetical protein